MLLLLERLNVSGVTELFSFYLLYHHLLFFRYRDLLSIHDQPATHIKLLLHLSCHNVLSILQYISVCGAFCHLFYRTSCTEQYIGRVIHVQGSILPHYCMLHLIQEHYFIYHSIAWCLFIQCTSVWRLLSSFLLPSNTERHLGIPTNLHSIFDNSCLQCILNCYRYAALDPRALVASLTLTVSNAQNSIIHCIEYSNAKQQRYYHYLS